VLTEAIGPLRALWRALVVFGTLLIMCLSVGLDRLGLYRVGRWMLGRSGVRLSWARALREAFEFLGPTYIKFGQIIASSEGLFSREMSEEFRLCLDQVPPVPFAVTRRSIETDFQRPLEEVFTCIAQEPLAAASIAQVHLAQLKDGRAVVVKVQRPGLARVVGADLRVMLFFTGLLERCSYRARMGNLVGIVEDFVCTLTQEMDFRLEGLNMDEFNDLLSDVPGNRVVAPRVHWDFTSPRVLTMEQFHGWRVDDVRKMSEMEDTEDELIVGVLAWMRTLLEAGVFHGDMHAGNLMYLEDGRIGFLDFGIVGRLEAGQRDQAMGFLLSLATGNFREFARIVWSMSRANDEVDLDVLAVDLKEAYEPLTRGDMGSLDYQQVLPGIERSGLKHGIKFPKEFTLITKQLLYFDRYARLLAPRLNFFTDPRITSQIVGMLPHISRPPATLAQPA